MRWTAGELQQRERQELGLESDCTHSLLLGSGRKKRSDNCQPKTAGLSNALVLAGQRWRAKNETAKMILLLSRYALRPQSSLHVANQYGRQNTNNCAVARTLAGVSVAEERRRHTAEKNQLITEIDTERFCFEPNLAERQLTDWGRAAGLMTTRNSLGCLLLLNSYCSFTLLWRSTIYGYWLLVLYHPSTIRACNQDSSSTSSWCSFENSTQTHLREQLA